VGDANAKAREGFFISCRVGKRFQPDQIFGILDLATEQIDI
jgi:hypothetical protein